MLLLLKRVVHGLQVTRFGYLQFAIDVSQAKVLGVVQTERLYARIGLYLLLEQLQGVVVRLLMLLLLLLLMVMMTLNVI